MLTKPEKVASGRPSDLFGKVLYETGVQIFLYIVLYLNDKIKLYLLFLINKYVYVCVYVPRVFYSAFRKLAQGIVPGNDVPWSFFSNRGPYCGPRVLFYLILV